MNDEDDEKVLNALLNSDDSIPSSIVESRTKTVYIKFPYPTWVNIAKMALDVEKARGDVVIDIINMYFNKS